MLCVNALASGIRDAPQEGRSWLFSRPNVDEKLGAFGHGTLITSCNFGLVCNFPERKKTRRINGAPC